MFSEVAGSMNNMDGDTFYGNREGGEGLLYLIWLLWLLFPHSVRQGIWTTSYGLAFILQ